MSPFVTTALFMSAQTVLLAKIYLRMPQQELSRDEYTGSIGVPEKSEKTPDDIQLLTLFNLVIDELNYIKGQNQQTQQGTSMVQETLMAIMKKTGLTA